MVSQPVKQQGELLEIFVDGGRTLAGVQQVLLELDHIRFRIVSSRSIPQRLDEAADVVLLVAELFRCLGQRLLFQVTLTEF